MSSPSIYGLCVDDEESILEIFSSTIASLNLTPLKAKTGEEALQLIKAKGRDIAIVISDIRMPIMDGIQLREAMMANNAHIPFIVISGYVTRELALKGVELKIAAFIEKPFEPAAVADLVKKEAGPRHQAILESRELQSVFIEEANNMLEQSEPLLLALEADPDNMDTVNSIFRLIHSIKGASGVLDTDIVTKYTHRYEDLISQVKNQKMKATPPVVSALLRGMDTLTGLVRSVTEGNIDQHNLDTLLETIKIEGNVAGEQASTGPKDKPQAQTTAAKMAPKDTLQVPTVLLDDVLMQSGEVTVIRNMVNKLVRSIEKTNPGQKEVALLGELLEEMHKINGVIQSKIVELRKVSLKNILKGLPRTVRDLSSQLKKPIQLVINGDNIRVDNSVAQVISGSIYHLVRNSADHGIEAGDARSKAGKNATGTIEIRCSTNNDEVNIAVADDGKGLDLERIKSKAHEKNLFTREELDAMPPQRLMSLIFESGFSTAAAITDVSGRGVGMDMVKSSVQSIGGKITIDSTTGKGSQFNLVLPIPKSVLIIDSVLIECSGHTFAIPQDRILRLLRLTHEDYTRSVQVLQGAVMITVDGNLLPLITLRDTLKLSDQQQPYANGRVRSIAVLATDQSAYALEVDEILDSEEIVVKALANGLKALQLYAGATFMGDGRIGLILDVVAIAKAAHIDGSHQADEDKTTVPSEIAGATDYLLFSIAPKRDFAIPVESVYRLEEMRSKDIQLIGDRQVIVYRNKVVPLYSVGELLRLKNVNTATNDEQWPALIVTNGDSLIALRINKIRDIIRYSGTISREAIDRKGLSGSLLLPNGNVPLVDIVQLIETQAQHNLTEISHASSKNIAA